MPEGSDNTEEQKPSFGKFKTAEELAAAYEALESKLGEQGEELGQYRTYVANLRAAEQARSTEETAEERKTADVSEYRRYADDLIAAPEEVLPKFADDLEARVMKKVEARVSDRINMQQKVSDFFHSNPELEKFKEIVSVIGERVYQLNPNLPFDQVLAQTKKTALEYIGTLEPRLKESKTSERQRAAITTSGGRTRETVEEREEESERAERFSPEQQSVMDEIKRIKDFRVKRGAPPRSRG